MSGSAVPESTPASNPFEGRTIARCRIGERLGRGRTSHVFKGFYEPLEKDVAIKILSGDLADEAEIRESFLREAKAIARLDHEHIVKVLDVVEDQDCLCILMEHVGGETLQDRLDDGGPLPPRKAARIARQIADALACAHAEKILHRDIKPANVILTKGSDQVKVVDFGLAGSTKLANRAGTPLYMSPEACQGKRVDDKTDVYALGVLLYQMLTGKLPFEGKTVKEILAAHVAGELVPPSAVKKDLDPQFDSILKKLLVKSKGYRPTAAEAAALLAPLYEDDLSGSRPDRRAGGGSRGGSRRGGGARRPEKKNNAVPIVLGLVAIVAGIGIVMWALNKDTGGGGAGAGEESPTQTGGAGNAGTGGTSEETPTPPTPAVDPAKEAYEAADEWSRKNPSDKPGQIEHFKKVEDAHAGSTFAERARGRREALEKSIADEKANEARIQREKELAAHAQEERDKLNVLVDKLDFDVASKLAESQKNLPEEAYPAWQARQRRIGYLAENLAKKLDEALKDYPRPLRTVDPAAAEVRDIVGADMEGLKWSDGSLTGVVKWSDLADKKDGLYALAQKVISQSSADGNGFLAILAAELWWKEGEDNKQCKTFREMVQLVDDVGGEGELMLRTYFYKK